MTSAEFNVSHLKAEAAEASANRDFGDLWFEEPLDVLLFSIRNEANLNDKGMRYIRKRIIHNLKTRLKVVGRIQYGPSISCCLNGPGLLITGLARSGTTILQRLMDDVGGLTSLLWWETAFPAYVKQSADDFPIEAPAMLAELSMMSPGLTDLHSLEVCAPDEEILLLEYSFMSLVPDSFMHLPTYLDYLYRSSHLMAYQELKTLLSLVAANRGGLGRRSWLLKSPSHLIGLNDFNETFPDTPIVYCDRRPSEAALSWCQLAESLGSSLVDDVDLNNIGLRSIRRTEMSLQSLANFRSKSSAKILPLSFHSILKDPLRVCLAALAYAGIEVDERDTETIAAKIEAKGGHRPKKIERARFFARSRDLFRLDSHFDPIDFVPSDLLALSHKRAQ